MVRSLVGFAGVAIVALLALRLLSGLFGFAISHLVLRVFAPGLADRLRELVRGNKVAGN